MMASRRGRRYGNIDAGVTLEELVTDVSQGLGLDRVKRIIAYAVLHGPHPA